jgi:hypothetical protein
MQLSMLLTSFLLLLSFTNAKPVFHRRNPNKFVTVPVKRYPYEPRNIHPLIASAQIVNRGLLRFARMSGAPDPPRELLERNLMRRVLAVEGADGLERRFNRRSFDDDDDTLVLEKRFNPYVSGVVPVANLKNLAAVGSQPNITPANKPTANNSLALDIDGSDTSYLATIQIGTPPRDFSILMDSGSADFWVGSEECQSTDGGGCGNHVFLGNTSSSSFVDTAAPFAIKYGKGSVKGTIINDDVSIAGLSLPGHVFGATTLESPEFSGNVPFDGLMGLGQSKLSNQKTLTPVEALAKAGLISDAILSYKLGRSRDTENDGEITFGGLDPSKFDPKTLVTVPNVDPRGFWTAALDGVTVGGKSLKLQGRTAILDTGTTLALLPLNDAIALHNQIPGATLDRTNGFTIPCKTTTVVSLTFGRRAFDIDPRDLSFIPVDTQNERCISGFAATNLGGTGNGSASTQWLVGDTFLKNVYLSTSVGDNSISLAKLV